MINIKGKVVPGPRHVDVWGSGDIAPRSYRFNLDAITPVLNG